MRYKKKLTVQRIPNNNMVPNASFATSNHYTPFDSIDDGLECFLFTAQLIAFVCCIDIYYRTIKYLLLLFVGVGVDDTAKQCGIAVLVDSMLLSIVLVGSGTVLLAFSMMITQMSLNRKKEEELR
jgi:hypothetical protein